MFEQEVCAVTDRWSPLKTKPHMTTLTNLEYNESQSLLRQPIYILLMNVSEAKAEHV